MRAILYIIILVLLFLAPVRPANVADLLPIEALALYTENGEVVLETDTGNIGKGVDAARALLNLKTGTPAIVYLDTARYLLIGEDAGAYAEQLRGVLKPSVKVCVCNARSAVKETAKYLSVHGDLPELRAWKLSEAPKKK